MSTLNKYDPLDKEHYRLISLLSHTSKVFEKILFNQINDYMEPYFSDLSKGFWRKHNTKLYYIIKNARKIETSFR